MADLGSRLRSTFADQASNDKFLELLNSNRKIQTIKDREIIPTVTLADLQPSGLPTIRKEKVALKVRSKSQAKIKPLPHALKPNSKTPLELDKEAGLQGIRVRSGSKNKPERNNSFDSLKNAQQSKQSSSHRKKSTLNFVTPHKIAAINELAITAKKTVSTNKTIINQIPNTEPLQNILLNVKFGKVQDGISYRAFIKKEMNPGPQQVIRKLDVWLSKFKIKTGLIETINLESIFRRKSIPNNMILEQFTNYSQLKKQYEEKIPGLRFYDPVKPNRGRNLAAAKVQSLFRMAFDKKYTKKLRSLMKKVIIIQKYWKCSLFVRKTRRQILERINLKIQRSNALVQKLMKDWEIVRTQPRIEVHICSLSVEEFKRLSFPNIRQRENCQLTRVFRVLQTDVSVIYVMPERMKGEVFRYFQRIFNFSNCGPVFRERLTFISLEQLSQDLFPYMTTASLLLYDSKSLSRIKQIVKNSPHSTAYIVPNYPSNQFINLSAQLNIPVFSASQQYCKLFSTKSGHYELLKTIEKGLGDKCPFELPKSIFGIYSEKQLINTLSVLIYKHRTVNTWYLKIDDEINSRGIAVFNTNSLTFLKQIKKQEEEVEEIPEKDILKLIVSELQAKLKSKLKVLNKEVYGSYEQYVSHFVTRGGFIQAGVEVPKNELTEGSNASSDSHPKEHSISFLIEPNGDFSIKCTYSRLEIGGKLVNSAIKCPSDLPTTEVDNEKIVRALYRNLWGKQKMFGFFTVDTLHIPVNNHSKGQTFIIGLDCFLNEKTSSAFVCEFTSKCIYDKDKNKYLIPVETKTTTTNQSQFSFDEIKKPQKNSQSDISMDIESNVEGFSDSKEPEKKELHFIYYPLMKFKELPSVQQFFKRSKFSNVSFDIQRKIGTLFMLVDSIEDGCIGFVSSAFTVQSMLDEANRLVQFFSKQFGSRAKKGGKSKGSSPNDDLGQFRGVLLNMMRKVKKNTKKGKQDMNLQLIF